VSNQGDEFIVGDWCLLEQFFLSVEQASCLPFHKVSKGEAVCNGNSITTPSQCQFLLKID
jgi:hypothetical protein